jgi:hypothetical protein
VEADVDDGEEDDELLFVVL